MKIFSMFFFKKKTFFYNEDFSLVFKFGNKENSKMKLFENNSTLYFQTFFFYFFEVPKIENLA
jgi:hypothetical protein